MTIPRATSPRYLPVPVPVGDGHHDIGDDVRAAIVERLTVAWSGDPDLTPEKARQLAMWAGAAVRALLHELGALNDMASAEGSSGESVPAESEWPRRASVQRWTPAEKAIADAVDVVEAAGCDVRLTDAVVLLQAARDSVADFVDGVDKRRFVRQETPHPTMQFELDEMHWQDGLMFKRLPDGSVRIRREPTTVGPGEIVERADPATVIATIRPNEWSSLILHVADHGADTNRVSIEQAIKFHGVSSK